LSSASLSKKGRPGSLPLAVLLWLPPLLVGAGLRAYRLPEQILTGDELHAINGALSLTLGEILRTWTYHGADYSVPLAAFFRALLDRGIVFTEIGFRAPALLASLALIPVAPLLLRPRIGRNAAVLLAWMLALSPMLVLYGRMVRSYAPTVLLATCAVIAFDRWWSRRPRPAAVAYVVLLGALAVYLHLGAAPFVLSPFLFALGVTLRDSEERRPRLIALAGLAAATAGAIALLLLPAASSLVALVGLHGGGRMPGPAAWWDVIHLQLGTRSTALLALLLLAAGRGLFVLARRAGADASWYVGCLLVGHVAGLVVLRPNFLHAPIVMNRYLLVTLPLVLSLVAMGLASRPAAWRGRSLGILHAVGVGGLMVWLVASGPLADDAFRFSSFTHAQPFVNFMQERERARSVPRFYRELPAGGEEPILEAPWTNIGTQSFHAYQRVHRHPLRMATLNRLHDDERVRFRNILPPWPDVILESDVRFVVVHVDVREEELRVDTPELRHGERLEKLPELWQTLRGAGVRMAARIQKSWGPPIYSDDDIRVWDVDQIRDPAR
jgi:hypothetical protein